MADFSVECSARIYKIRKVSVFWLVLGVFEKVTKLVLAMLLYTKLDALRNTHV